MYVGSTTQPLCKRLYKHKTDTKVRDCNIHKLIREIGEDKFYIELIERDVQDSVLDSLKGKREGCLRAGSTQRRPVLPSPAPPRRPAVRRPDPTGPWCVRVLDSTCSVLGYALHEKGFQRQRGVGTTGQQPGTKSARGPADQPLINRG